MFDPTHFIHREETPAKALRHINKDEVPIVQVVQVQVTPAPLIDHSDFLEAMEQLVGRLDELVGFVFENDTHRLQCR